MRRIAALAPVALALTLAPWNSARAFDAAGTHAGLTESAALASTLGRVLTTNYGCSLGLYDSLRLRIEGERGEQIEKRLAKLDPTEGYAPDHGRLTALGWLVAGSVAEEIPGDRDRNHFYDPSTGRGLDQGGFLDGLGLRLRRASGAGGSVRGVFTGSSFDGTGMPSIAWLNSDQNDFSLGHFIEARARATSAATRGEREEALAESLLVAGALLHVVEDAGDPAHVRNDYRVSIDQLGAPLSRLIAARFGRLLMPPPSGGAEPLDHLADAIHTRAATGLADRTQRRFFSEGTLPGAQGSSALPKPVAEAGAEARGYVSGDRVKHLAAWVRDARGEVHWQLDRRCLDDYADATLPDTERAALSAIEHLFRGSLRVQSGSILNGDLDLGAGKIQIFADDDKGVRRAIGSAEIHSATAGDKLIDLPGDLHADTFAALFHGADVHGEPIVIALEISTK